MLLLALFFCGAHLVYADCSTYLYGGVGGNPNDTGAYGSWVSSAYRLNGNEVYMYSNTGVTGVNAGLVITHVTAYYYRNNSLVQSNRSDNPFYGGTVTRYITQSLYSGGQYFLGTLQLGKPSDSQNDHWGTSPVCGINSDNDPYVKHYYDSSNTYLALKPTIQVTGDTTGATRWPFWYLGGAPTIDLYYTQVALTGHSNWGIDTSPINWTTILGGDKINTYPNTGSQVMVTSLAPSGSSGGQYAYDIDIQTNTDGLPSDPFPLSINAPWSVLGYLTTEGYYTGSQGYKFVFNYLLYDKAGLPINTPITLHETIENCILQQTSSNWCGFPPKISTWAPADWQTGTGQWQDKYWVDWTSLGTLLIPQPQYVTPPGTTTVMSKTQKFFVGSAGDPGETSNVFSGMCVQRNGIQFYTDHADRMTPTTPIAGSLCAEGQYANFD